MFKLYDYQVKSVQKMHPGCVLCGAVGSGKSLTSLEYYIRNFGDRKLYIITTAKKRDSQEWVADLLKIGLDPNEVIIDSWNNIKRYTKEVGAFFIFDEQRLVGSGAWVKSFYKISVKNKWVLLTGTPGDTWNDYIPLFVANGFYKNKTQFQQEHVIFDRYCRSYPKIKGYYNTKKLERLKAMLLVSMDYKPPNLRHDNYIHCEYDKDMYTYLIKDRWDPFANKPIENVAQLYSLLRKITYSDPSRAESVLDLIADRDRVIIFYNYDFELEILRSLDYDDRVVAEWNGHKKQPVPSCYRWIYLCQYASASEAWNCTSTNTMIFYSLNPSYKMTEQAHGRIDRNNNTLHELYYYSLVSNAPFDKANLRALKNKKDFNEHKFAHSLWG